VSGRAQPGRDIVVIGASAGGVESLNRRLAKRSSDRGKQGLRLSYRKQASDADENAAVVRELLETFEAAPTPDPASEQDSAAARASADRR
jgi:hypothetical protein